MGALDGIRVIDLTRILAGPFATMKLSDHGAEVIKVEEPGKGDDTRGWGPPFANEQSVYFLSVNRGKKSLTLNLKDPEGKRIIERLLATADVVVSNFRPGTMERLGLAYKKLAELNPRLVYCTISGYGDVPAGEASYDVVVQGESGIMELTGQSDGLPTKIGVSVADMYAGTLAVEGILLALLARQTTGKGQKIDIALLDGMLSLLTFQGQGWLSCGVEPRRLGNAHPSIVPYETFPTADGHINIGVGSETLWQAFCKVIARPELAANPRFATNSDRVAKREELIPLLKDILRGRKTVEWLKELRAAGIPAGPIQKVSQVLGHADRRKRQMVVDLQHPLAGKLPVVGNPVKLSDTPPELRLPPPLLGQHNHEILAGLGYSEEELEDLRKRGVV